MMISKRKQIDAMHYEVIIAYLRDETEEIITVNLFHQLRRDMKSLSFIAFGLEHQVRKILTFED